MFIMEEHRSNCPTDSSAAPGAGFVGVRCPQCPAVTLDETSLASHLLTVHNMRLVVTSPSQSNFLGSTAASSSSSSSPMTDDSTPPVAGRTGCPVCRQQVEDLPQHFAFAHSQRHSSAAASPATAVASAPAALQQKLLQLKRQHSKSSARLIRLKVKEEEEEDEEDEEEEEDRENEAINLSVRDGQQGQTEPNNNSAAGSNDDQQKARRKQTSVPEREKDQRYWTRRLKNNEAAKRSRDMRIQREKIIFDENARLEEQSNALLLEKDRLTTDNKELRLKMDFILEENVRLKAVIESLQQHHRQGVNEFQQL